MVFGNWKFRGIAMLALAGLLPAAGVVAADGDQRIEVVRFAKDASSATLTGSIKGNQYVDYKVRAGAGQTLSVMLKSGNPQNYFNINPPGTETSMFIGSTSGHQAKRVLPNDGDYSIRVYLMRAAARRDETGSYTLTVSLDGKALPALSAAKDALIRGTPFHASGYMKCTRADNPQLKSCDGYVIRRGRDGTATLEVRWPDGIKRSVLFVRMQPTASDSTNTMTYTRTGEVTVVSIGNDERYEVPDVLLTGG